MERILPSYPLFIKDPNFSIWHGTEILNEQNVETWFGEKKRIYGFLRTDNKTYCFMGNANEFAGFHVQKAEQTKINVSLFSTDYEFLAGNVKLKVSFVSPLPLTNLELLSLPVCYIKYEIEGDENAEIAFFVNRNIAYTQKTNPLGGYVRGGVAKQSGFESVFLGLARQLPLSNSEDIMGADWGYFYLSGKESFLSDEKELFAYVSTGELPTLAEGDERFLMSRATDSTGIFMLGYDERVAIDYFGAYRKGIYLNKHTILEGLQFVWDNYLKIEKELSDFEQDLQEKAKKFGEEYIKLLNASYRQSVGAHKLITDEDGEILWLSKECASNGCIGTVDVSYPSMPLYLLYAPKLVKGMMLPIVKFARMPIWKYDFAPHDVGTYPICGGQVYGLKQETGNKYHAKYIYDNSKEKTWTNFPVYLLPASFEPYKYERQMPVEECANMLIMTYALYKSEKSNSFFMANKDLFDKWVKYLVEFGLKPEDQLCTDDFAGKLANNINLAVKAVVGIASYAELAKAGGDTAKHLEYRKIAEAYAKEISDFANGKSHLPLTWDLDEDTFSLKYNLAFDKIFKLGLFGQDLLEKEVDYYLQKTNTYGCPLDYRKTFGKSDWLVWAASLTDCEEKREKLLAPLYAFLKETPDRVPFTDWYDVESGKAYEFKARTTQGACFILLLSY